MKTRWIWMSATALVLGITARPNTSRTRRRFHAACFSFRRPLRFARIDSNHGEYMLRHSVFFSLVMVALVGMSTEASAAAANTLTLTSPNIGEGRAMVAEQVFNAFGCTGANVSPELRWSGAPAATKSFALTMYDPDAPTGSGWWHWVAVDIPANSAVLAKGWGKSGTAQLAGGRQTRTDFGAPGYGGPCPPPGAPHRYIFTIFALDIDKLPVPDDASGALVGFNIGGHTLAKASITARYGQ